MKLPTTSHTHSHLFLFLLLSLFHPISVAQPSADSNNNENYSQLNQFNPSLAIIIVILVAALFLMGFFSIYVRQCADSPSASVLPTAAARSRRAPRGLDASVIATFPILEYSEVKIHKIGKEALECAVCLCEFEDTETLRLIPKCDHVFHPDCIDEWLSSHTTCPVCRANLLPQPPDSLHAPPESNSPQNHPDSLNDAVLAPPDPQIHESQELPVLSEPDLIDLGKSRTLNRNRTRGSRSSRTRRFPRSHSTGHSLVQPNHNIERFTLKLPAEVRKEIMNRELQRTSSLVAFPGGGGEGSSRRGYRTGEGSSRGNILRRLNRSFKSDRWVLTMAPPFLVRGSSIKSPRVLVNAGEGTSASATVSDSAPIMPPSNVDSARLPV